MAQYQNIPIKEWSLEDRPREKLLQKGIEALTDAELIAIILSSGTQKHSAIDIAREMLREKGNLMQIARAGVAELTRFKGVGKAKAIALVAAFELGRRKHLKPDDKIKITSAEIVAAYMKPRLSDLDQEVFHVLFLNRNNVVIAEKQFFKGGVAATVIDTKIIFREAVHNLSSAMILVHNHPSGNLTPSHADVDITRKVIACGKIFEIQVLDHVIVSHQGYYSFADHDLMGS